MQTFCRVRKRLSDLKAILTIVLQSMNVSLSLDVAKESLFAVSFTKWDSDHVHFVWLSLRSVESKKVVNPNSSFNHHGVNKFLDTVVQIMNSLSQ